jgi:hypothetical protein
MEINYYEWWLDFAREFHFQNSAFGDGGMPTYSFEKSDFD